VLDTSGPLLIHVTRSRRPEVVLFGLDQCLRTPLALEAGNHILVTGSKPDEIAVSKFMVNEPDQKRMVSNRIDEVVRAIVELGGTYPDVVQALQQAKASGVLASRFEIDALPEAGRFYRRETAGDDDQKDTKDRVADKSAPSPGNVDDWSTTHNSGTDDKSGKKASSEPDSGKSPHPVRSFFAKMTGRGSD